MNAEKSKDFSKRRNWKEQPPKREKNLSVIPLTEIDEQIPNWLVTDYMPRYQITSLAGDGGSGKTQYGVRLRRQSAAEQPLFF